MRRYFLSTYQGAGALPLHLPGPPYTLLAVANKEKTLRQVDRGREGATLYTSSREDVFWETGAAWGTNSALSGKGRAPLATRAYE